MPASPRRRAFGQHFLKDQSVIASIVESTFSLVEKTGAPSLLEIGPGKGAITEPLLQGVMDRSQIKKFLIVEMDRKLATHWQESTQDLKSVEVISKDFLEVDDSRFIEGTPWIVVSNLPYSSGTAIFQKLARLHKQVRGLVLMFQAEVAQRLRAEPDTKAWGTLSLWTQNRWTVEKLKSVPPGAFIPPPDVNSEVVVLLPRAETLLKFPEGFEPDFEKMIKLAFLHRRKMLRSGLPKGSVWLESLARSGVEPTKRAEALSWKEWQAWINAHLALS